MTRTEQAFVREFERRKTKVLGTPEDPASDRAVASSMEGAGINVPPGLRYTSYDPKYWDNADDAREETRAERMDFLEFVCPQD